MNKEVQGRIRVYVLDSLVSQSGKALTPDVIGDLTQEIVSRMMDLFALMEDKR
jgi:hypothetical protein